VRTETTLLIATSNRGKLREVQAVLESMPVRLKTTKDFPGIPEPIEDGVTFEENARKKALHYAGLTKCLTLADDSGLEVDALGGAPGVYSARYAGVRGDDAANNARLIAALSGVPAERRTARFRCVVALAIPDKVLAVASGAMEGLIVDDPRGHNGFGYDPHFFISEFGMTSAQLPPEQKNRISHRGRALAAIRCAIERMAESTTRLPYFGDSIE
jgi:XTP/dITP diphosphohydrolase